MKTILLVTLLLGSLYAEPEKCQRYRCAALSDPKGCSKTEKIDDVIVHTLNPCKNQDEFCDFVHPFGETDQCVLYGSRPELYPGEFCKDDQECISGTCQAKKKGQPKVCIGNEREEYCDNDGDCNPGLYCHSHLCKPVVPLGSKCDDEHKCSATGVCDLNECVLIGSKSPGDASDVPAACSTFFIFKGECAKGPKLKADGVAQKAMCPKTGECVYKLEAESGIKITQPCKCGMVDDTAPYCMPGNGDIQYSDVSCDN